MRPYRRREPPKRRLRAAIDHDPFGADETPGTEKLCAPPPLRPVPSTAFIDFKL